MCCCQSNLSTENGKLRESQPRCKACVMYDDHENCELNRPPRARWVRVEGECYWCGYNGPHKHSVKIDGTLGILIRPITEEN